MASTSSSGAEEPWEVWWCHDGWHPAGDRLAQILPDWAILKRMDPKLPLSEQVSNARVLIPTTGIVNKAAIMAANGLRLIAQPAAGYNNIDIEAAKQRGVPVTLAPGSNSHSVAEVALMMILMLSRRADEARAVFSRQEPIGNPVGWELTGKTLGVVGLGKVGQRLAAVASTLGMTVIGITSKSTSHDLQELLQSSDVVSLHCPLGTTTHNLIGRNQLALMKPHALLINCARGDVIHKEALLEALQEGKLGGVGLDTHWIEPANPSEPLYQHPKVLALPHLGSISAEVYDRFANILCENIVRIREGRELLHQLC